MEGEGTHSVRGVWQLHAKMRGGEENVCTASMMRFYLEHGPAS
jgi:hypothetical protein